MIEPLSSGWLRQLEAATAAIETDSSINLVIQLAVESNPPLEWFVAINDGSATTVVGSAIDPDITLQTDRETAVGIATGRISAQRAFLEGTLRIGGRIEALIEARPFLEKIGDSLRIVREATDVTSQPATD